MAANQTENGKISALRLKTQKIVCINKIAMQNSTPQIRLNNRIA